MDFITWALPVARAFRCKSSPFLPATPLRAPGFTLQSLTRPTRNTVKIYFTCHYIFFKASLMDTRNDVMENGLTALSP